MSEQADQNTPEFWHKKFAAECNNLAWDLTSRSGRTPEEDRRMLHAAFAAAYHWSQVGTPLHDARADVTLAHVLSLLGRGTLAMECARRCLDYFENHPAEDWDLAFAHAELAYAAAVSGDRDLHREHYARAKELGEAIQEDEDRQVFLEEFTRIPSTVIQA